MGYDDYFDWEEYDAYMAIGTKEFDYDNYDWGWDDDPEYEFMYQLCCVEATLDDLDKKLGGIAIN